MLECQTERQFFPLELNKLPGELEELTDSKYAANSCVETL